MLLMLTAALYCTPVAIDGDTIRCGSERIRLIGIDAPEMSGCHGAKGRVCVPGDPHASRRSLAQALKARPLLIERTGKDRYGRSLGLVSAGGKDLSCLQITTGHAVYVAKWDYNARLKSICISPIKRR